MDGGRRGIVLDSAGDTACVKIELAGQGVLNRVGMPAADLQEIKEEAGWQRPRDGKLCAVILNCLPAGGGCGLVRRLTPASCELLLEIGCAIGREMGYEFEMFEGGLPALCVLNGRRELGGLFGGACMQPGTGLGGQVHRRGAGLDEAGDLKQGKGCHERGMVVEPGQPWVGLAKPACQCAQMINGKKVPKVGPFWFIMVQVGQAECELGGGWDAGQDGRTESGCGCLRVGL